MTRKSSLRHYIDLELKPRRLCRLDGLLGPCRNAYHRAMYSKSTRNITVSVSTKFLPDQSSSEKGRWFWAYTIQISNGGNDTVQLRRRYWKITNAVGECEVVDGPGVVGEEPIIAPGESYQYTSGCPLNTSSGTMEGYYIMQREDGSYFEAAIPAFSLDMPNVSRTLN